MAELVHGGPAPPLSYRELQQWRALWVLEAEEARHRTNVAKARGEQIG